MINPTIKALAKVAPSCQKIDLFFTRDSAQSKSTGHTHTGPIGNCKDGSNVRDHCPSHIELLGPPHKAHSSKHMSPSGPHSQ